MRFDRIRKLFQRYLLPVFILAAFSGVAFADFTGNFGSVPGAQFDSGFDDQAYGIAVDTISGNGPFIYTVGSTSAGVNGLDFLAVKYNSDGVLVASTTFHYRSMDVAYGVAVDHNGDVVVTGKTDNGTTTSDILTIKYNNNLVFISSAGFNSGVSDEARSVAIDANNNIIIAGQAVGAVNLDYFVAKYDPNLVLLSSASFGGAYGDMAYGVAVDTAGSVYATGELDSGSGVRCVTCKFSAGLSFVSSTTFMGGDTSNGQAIAVSGGSVYVAGYDQVGSPRYAVTLRYTTDLVFLSSASFNLGGDQNFGYGVGVSPSEYVYMTGKGLNGQYNFMMVKYTAALVSVATVTYNNSFSCEGHAVAVGISSYVYAAGWGRNASSDYDWITRRYAIPDPDLVAPGGVTSLVAVADIPGQVQLSWVAPGDDGTTDVLKSSSQIRVQYSTDPGAAWSFSSAQVSISTSGVTPGTSVSYTVTGLAEATTYYFRLWHADESLNWSPLSNAATAQTMDILVHVWTGAGADALAHTAGNWAYNAAPLATDSVVFGSTGTGNPCQWDLPLISSITIVTGYTSTVTVATATFVNGSLTVMDGTFAVPGGSITVRGDIAYTGGDFDVRTATLSFAGAGTQFVNVLPGTTFWSLTLFKNTSAATVFCNNAEIYINGLFFCQQGKFETAGSTVHFRGNAGRYGGDGFYAGSGLWIFDGPALQQTIDCYGTVHDLTVYKVNGGTVTLTDSIVIGGDFLVTQGVIKWTNSETVAVCGNITVQSPGMANSGNGSFRLLGSSDCVIDVWQPLRLYAYDKPAAASITFARDTVFDDLTTGGTFDIRNRQMDMTGGVWVTNAAVSPFLTDGSTVIVRGQIYNSSATFNVLRLASPSPSLQHNFAADRFIIDPGVTANLYSSVSSLRVTKDSRIYGQFDIRTGTFTAYGPVSVSSGGAIDLRYAGVGIVQVGNALDIGPAGGIYANSSQDIIRSTGTSYYPFTVSGGTVNIAGLTLQNLNTLTIADGSYIQNLSTISFVSCQNGSTAFRFLQSGTSSYSFNEFDFDASVTTSIAAPNIVYPGYVAFTNWSGAGAGSGRENDPNDIIYWNMPAAPIAFTGTALSSGSIQWSWFDSAEEQTYAVYNATGGVIISLPRNTTSWIEGGLLPNTTHMHLVRASNPLGWQPSGTSQNYTLAAVPAGTYVAGRSSYSVQIAWNANGNPASTAWGIVRSTDNFTLSFSTRTSWGTNYSSTTYTDTGVTDSTTYYYRVQAFNGEGYASAFDAIVSTATLMPPPDLTSPGYSTLFAYPGTYEGEVRFTWSAPGNDAWDGALPAGSEFRIQYATWTAISWSTAAAQIAVSTQSAYVGESFEYYATGLTGGDTYYFKLWHADPFQNWSILFQTATSYAQRDLIAPGVVTAFSASAGTQIRLSWTSPGDNTYSGAVTDGRWRIRYSTSAAADANTAEYTLDISTNFAQGAGFGLTLTGLRPRATYYFWMAARDENAVNWSSFTSVRSAVAGSFVDSGLVFTGLDNTAVGWADYDNDGRLDVAVAGNNGSGRVCRIYHNDGGSFTDISAGLTGVDQASLAWGDYNNDGLIDLAVAGNADSGESIKVYRNAGGGSFIDSGNSLTGVRLCSIAWGDYDNDGALDLAVGGFNGTTRSLTIYHNDHGNLSDAGIALTGVQQCSLAWGDYDDDGYSDLAVAGWTGSGRSLKAYRNTGGSLTDSGLTFGGLTLDNCSVAWGDYDIDGRLDLAVAGYYGAGGYTRVFHNTGGSLADAGISMQGLEKTGLAWGDYDNSGFPDFAVAGSTDTAATARYTKVYASNGGSGFTDTGETLPGLDQCSLAWADYDGDGALDLMMSGNDGTTRLMRLYRSLNADFGIVNSTPSTPFSFVPSYAAKLLTIGWSGPNDTETYDSRGLFYDVRVGTTPGGSQIVSGAGATPFLGSYPHGNITTGNPGIKLNLTQSGTYYWSVRSIDAGLRRSSWSTEMSTYCYVDNTLPSVSILVPQNGAYLASLTTISGSMADNIAVSSVTVNIKRNDTGACFNGADWSGSSTTWLTASLSQSTWSLTAFGWASNSSYTVTARAYDSSRNLSTGTVASIFTIDYTQPGKVTGFVAYQSGIPNVVSLNWITPGSSYYAMPLPSGSEYRVQYATGNYYAVSWATASAQVSISTSAVTPGLTAGVTLTMALNEQYLFTLWARDAAGNWSVQSDSASAFASPFAFGAAAHVPGSNLDNYGGIAVDTAGVVHTVYRDATTQNIRYARYDGSAWYFEDIDTSGDIQGAASVAVDASGVPHVSYRRTAGIWHADRSAGSWQRRQIDGAGLATSLAIDGKGRPHVSYYRTLDNTLCYASWTGTAWSTSTVESVGSGTGYTSLAITADGSAHIAYYDSAATKLKYARWSGSAWSIVDVDATSNAGLEPAIALDGAGNAHISYHVSAPAYDLRYASYTSFGWNWESVDVEGTAGTSSALCIDGNGQARIAYERYDTHSIKYAVHSSSGWALQDVDTYGNTAGYIGMAIGSAGNIDILYQGATDSADADMKFARYQSANIARPMGGTRGSVQAPAGVTAATVNVSSVTWQWTDNAVNEFGYRVYLATAAATPYTLVAGTATIGAAAGTGTVVSWDHTGLIPNTSYFMYAAAVNAGGYAAAPAPLIWTHAAQPSTLDVTQVNISSVQVSWSPAGNPSHTDYYLEFSTDTLFVGTISTVAWATGVSAASMNNLLSNTTYYGRIKARNAISVETGYTTAQATATLAMPVTATAIGPVTETTARVNWVSVNPSGTQYEAECSSISAGGASFATSSQITGYADFTGLAPNTTYYFRVRPVNWNNVPAAWTTLGSTHTYTNPPASLAFTSIAVNSVGLQWAANGNPDGTQYVLEYASGTPAVFPAVMSSSGMAFNHAGLQPDTTYYYRVKAVNFDGYASAYISSTTYTLASAPSSLTLAVITSSRTQVSVSGANQPHTRYEITYASVTAGQFMPAATMAGPGTLQMSGLMPNTTYFYRARSRNLEGTYSSSIEVSTVTQCSAPDGLAYGPVIGQTQMMVNWSASSPDNPADTIYIVQLSTASNFSGTIYSSATVRGVASSTAAVSGLSVNTTYYCRVIAQNHLGGTVSAIPVSSWRSTLTEVPDNVAWGAAGANSLIANWAGDTTANPSNTIYILSFSTSVSMLPVAGSSVTTKISGSAIVAGLLPNTSYYGTLQSRNWDYQAYTASLSGPAHTLALPPISSMVVNRSSHSIALQWSAAGNPSYTAWGIIRSTDGFITSTTTLKSFGDTYTTTGYLDAGLDHSTTYFYRIQAFDMAGVATAYDAVISTATMQPPDGATPVAAVTNPVNNAILSSLLVVSGTAFDPGWPASGVENVSLRVRNTDSGMYWDNSAKTFSVVDANAAWFLAISTSAAWDVWQATGIAWVNNTHYQIAARAYDYSGQYSTIYSTAAFLFDTELPVSAVTLPATQDGDYSSVTMISGTAQDTVSSVTGVAVSLTRESDTRYWDGSSWAVTPQWLTAGFGGGVWSITTSTVSWTNGSYYVIYSSATDIAGNVQGVTASRRFRFVPPQPISRVTLPVNGAYYSSLPAISGTAIATATGGSIASAELQIANIDDGMYWNGSSWIASSTWVVTSYSSPTWNYGGVTWVNDRRYNVVSRAQDNYATWQVAPDTVTFMFEQNKPVSAVQYPANATPYQSVTAISGTATDPVGAWPSGVSSAYVRLVRTEDTYAWTGSSWTAGSFWMLASGTTSWALSSLPSFTSGYYTINVAAIDNASNLQVVYTTSTFYVIGTATQLVLALPGETFTDGVVPGKSGTPSPRTAGAAFTATVRAVDHNYYLNTSAGGSASVATSDAFDTEPSPAVLVSGQQTFSVTLLTAATAQVTATLGGLTPSTTSVYVMPAAADRLQVLVPGESPVPGSSTGITGTPSTQTAGASFTVTVNLTDPYWNRVALNEPLAAITTSDPYDTHPAAAALLNGTLNFSVTLIRATTETWTVTATDTDGTGTLYTSATSAAIPMAPNSATRLLLTMPGETYDPGKPPYAGAGGKSGTASPRYSSQNFTVTVRATDNWFNINTSAGPNVTLTSSDSAAVLGGPATISAGIGTFTARFMTEGSSLTVCASDSSASLFSSTGTAVTVNDGIVPAAISDLAAVAGPVHASIRLAWTAPGDNDVTGDITGGRFVIRYSSAGQITDFTSPPAPYYELAVTSNIVAGSGQTYLITGLLSWNTYYFALRTGDEIPNYGSWSTVGVNTSNLARPADLVNPVITDNQPGQTVWYAVNPGSVFNVDFADPYAGLDTAQYTVYSQAALAGTQLVGWTNIAAGINAPSLITDWGLDYNSMIEGSNYVSVRVTDLAGNTSSYTDAFIVRKDTTQPTAPFLASPIDAIIAPSPLTFDWADASDGLSGVAGYNLQVALDEGFAGIDVSTVVVPSTVALPFSSAWRWWRVRTIDAASNYSVWSSTRSVNIISTQPDAPTNLTAVAVSSTSIRWMWLDNANNESEYRFYVSPGVYNTLAANATWYLETGLTPNTASNNRSVVAKNVSGESLPSNTTSCYTLANAPTGTAVSSVTYTGALLYWNANSNPANTGYGIERSFDASFTTATATASGETTGLSSMVSGLDAETTYYFRIRSVNGNGVFSVYDATVSAVTPPGPPAAPATLAGVAVSTGSILWYWTDSSNRESGYRIYDASATLIASVLANVTFYLETGLAANTACTRTVKAYNVSGEGSASPAVTRYTLANNPALTSSAQTPSSITLTWSAGTGGSSGYALERSTDAGLSYGIFFGTLTVLTYTDSGLAADTTYYYRLFAANGDLIRTDGVLYAVKTAYVPPQIIAGRVTQADGQPVTGVEISAAKNGTSLMYVVNTSTSGDFRIDLDAAVADGTYRVTAKWTASGIVSAVYKDNVPNGRDNVNFTLEVSYQLATISGQIQIVRAGKFTNHYGADATASPAWVELLLDGKIIAKIQTAPDGSYAIPNLLPGRYGVRAYNGVAYSRSNIVDVREGDRLDLTFNYDLLTPEKVYSYPNPAVKTDNLSIHFETSGQDIETTINIFTVSGELVKTVNMEHIVYVGTTAEYRWDLTNNDGQRVASGVYVYQVRVKNKKTGDFAHVTKKLAVIR